MSQLKTVDDASFAQAVDRASGLSVVDFSAGWCPPCRMIEPALEQLAGEYASRVEVMSLDVDANPATAARFGVRSLPTVLFFRDGAVVDRVVGAVPKSALRQRFEALSGG
ncbi:MAG TPA: thioredoxin [Longimicrobiaceae bacterium]|nr:thioredoxin [Longimicrobiaceae bacterium]